MKIKFKNEIPSSYSLVKVAPPSNSSVKAPKSNPTVNFRKTGHYPSTKHYQGEEYLLSGKYEKHFTLRHRVWVGVRSFFKSLLIVPLCFHSVRDDWKSFWRGKRIIILYLPPHQQKKELLKQNLILVEEKKKQVKKVQDLVRDNSRDKLLQEDLRTAKSDLQKAINDLKNTNNDLRNTLNNLGMECYTGRGCKKSIKRAKQYWEAAAALDYHFANHNLGLLYLERKNYAKAKHYFKIAAGQGNSFSRKELEILAKLGY